MGVISEQISAARVLVYDVETRPAISMHWQHRGDMYIGPDQMFDPGGVMAWSAQWLGSSNIMYASDHHDGHADMIAGLHELLSAADVVVGFNHERFDSPLMAMEFDAAGLARLVPVPQIDLLKVARSNFKLPHYKLGYLARRFDLSAKMSNDGWDLWRCCITDADGRPYLEPIPKGGGCEKHWRQMKRYARQDTKVTTELYWYLRRGGWIKKHPHAGLFGASTSGCPACGGRNRTATKPVVSGVAAYPGWRCDDCQHVYRGVKAIGKSTATRNV